MEIKKKNAQHRGEPPPLSFATPSPVSFPLRPESIVIHSRPGSVSEFTLIVVLHRTRTRSMCCAIFLRLLLITSDIF